MNNTRRLSMFLSLIIHTATLSLVIAALFTDYWTESTPVNKKFSSDNNYVNTGLFRGSRQLDWGLGPRYKPFAVYDELHDRSGFMSKITWIFIIFFFVLGLLWNTVGIIVSLINTVATEQNTIAGPKGIYLWSTLAGWSDNKHIYELYGMMNFFLATSYGAALVIFLYQYFSTIRDNVLLEEHLLNGFSTKNHTRLSFSFYFVPGAILLLLIPCLTIYFTSPKNSRTHYDKRLSVDNTVFMY